MPHYTGKNGELRIYDSTAGEDLSAAGPVEFRVSNFNTASHVDVTSEATSQTGSSTFTAWSDSDGLIYIGCKFPFNVVDVLLDTVAAADTGSLVVEYWNGAWTAVSNLSDGTESGGNTFRGDGQILWTEPTDWVVNDPPTTGTNLYYVRLSPTTYSATDPVVEYISAISGQYFKVLFVNVDFNGPIGRARPDQNLALDRGNLTADSFYYSGPDDPILEPLDLSFSASIDESVNRAELYDALLVGTPGSTEWPNAGVSSKGDTSLVAGGGSSVVSPLYEDGQMKTVNVHVRWAGTSNNYLLKYNEVYFPPEEQTIGESEDLLSISLNGQIYGTIVETNSGTAHFGNILT